MKLFDKYGQEMTPEEAAFIIDTHNVAYFSRWTPESIESYWRRYAGDAADEPDFHWEDVEQNAMANLLDDHGYLSEDDDQQRELFEEFVDLLLDLSGRTK